MAFSYRATRTPFLVLALIAFVSTSTFAGDLYDYAGTGSSYALYVDHSPALPVAVESSEAVTLPEFVPTRSSVKSVTATNAALPVDRVRRWRGLLRE